MPAQQLSPKKWGRPEYEKESTLAWHFSSCKNGKTLCSGRAGPAWWVNRILSLSKTWLPDSSVQPADVSLSKILNPQQLQGCLECFRFFCPGCLQESLIKIIIKPIICLKLSITAAPLLILCRNVSVSLSNPLPKSPFCCDCSPSWMILRNWVQFKSKTMSWKTIKKLHRVDGKCRYRDDNC